MWSSGELEHKSRGSSGPMNYWWESRRDPPRSSHFTSSSPRSRVNQAKWREGERERDRERRNPLFGWRTITAYDSKWIMDEKTAMFKSVLEQNNSYRSPAQHRVMKSKRNMGGGGEITCTLIVTWLIQYNAHFHSTNPIGTVSYSVSLFSINSVLIDTLIKTLQFFRSLFSCCQ